MYASGTTKMSPPRNFPLGAFNVRTDPVLLSVLVVEAPRDISRELEVLALVLAHWDEVGLVEQDVRRHQHRVSEESVVRVRQ